MIITILLVGYYYKEIIAIIKTINKITIPRDTWKVFDNYISSVFAG